LTASHLEVAVEGQKLAYTVHFTSYKAVHRSRRQSRVRKWRQWHQVTGIHLEVTSFDRKSTGSGCRKPKTHVLYIFHFLQGRSSQEAVMLQEMTSRDLWWLKVTQNWRHLTASHLEVAVEAQKFACTLHFTSYKAVARRRRQSR